MIIPMIITAIIGTVLLSFLRNEIINYIEDSDDLQNALDFDNHLDELEDLMCDIDDGIVYEILSQVSNIWYIYNSDLDENGIHVSAIRHRDCKIVMRIIDMIVSMVGQDVGTIVNIQKDIEYDLEYMRLHGNVDQSRIIKDNLDKMLCINTYKDPDSILLGLKELYKSLSEAEEMFIEAYNMKK